MNVYLFGFQKKKNSTAQPVLNTGTDLSCNLKDNTSVTAPVLLFNPNTQGMPVPFTPSYYTYVYIPKFERYYFINDWKYVCGLWECYLSVDVLASFKTAIGNLSCYVERSASTYNGNIIDTLYPAKTDVQLSYASVSTSWNGVAPSGGSYIIGVINNQSSSHIGAVSYYALNTTQLNSLMEFLFGNDIFTSSSITEVGEGMFKSLFNPFQYIVSCIWLPGSPSEFGSSTGTIKVGYWDTGVTAYKATANAHITGVYATIPNHPQASTRGAFLNFAPYTRLTLFCPPFGVIPVDPTFTRWGKYLNCEVIIDVITGQATFRGIISAQSSGQYYLQPFTERTAMFGVPIQLAQVLTDYSSTVTGVTNSLTSGSIAGLITGLIGTTVSTALATQSPKVATSGANGSFLNFMLNPTLVIEHTLLADEDNTDLGRPLMAVKTLNTLSGYIKCAEGHFNGSCYNDERDTINAFLVGGFFYE